MPKAINWGKVLYDDKEKKLLFFDQKVVRIPEAVINLFHDRVKILDLSNNKIHCLSSLENFSNLDELILDNNMITEEVTFPKNSSKLRLLSLNNNRIKVLDVLLKKIERAFPHLQYLSLLGNTACPYFFLNFDFESYFDYRLHVISHLRNLKFLDTKRVTIAERQIASDRAPSPVETQSAPTSLAFDGGHSALGRFWPTSLFRREPKLYSPLPESEPRNPRIAYGKLNYKYTGKESEGNRFIVNKDL